MFIYAGFTTKRPLHTKNVMSNGFQPCLLTSVFLAAGLTRGLSWEPKRTFPRPGIEPGSSA